MRHVDNDGWLVPVSDEWKGDNMIGGAVLSSGPDARAAALTCLD